MENIVLLLKYASCAVFIIELILCAYGLAKEPDTTEKSPV